ncbi:DUF3857 domain-containing protein [Pontibacter akesuensis]|uniref:Transglutaminase-like superfamily protein n=1 Tax=Pontibacter akesuensis TaxID=388950 RepID=A0A1I7HZZ0_9BACT|nr:DUF3857 domain-containing protein [Pontibacter akesuensis]GHA64471.1 hypothetical protein GCM10007389_16490 [Pontibacter akesuensis]SFU66292.1 Transglutaminase-like superfamily protein [Pontibacter akesuensis]
MTHFYTPNKLKMLALTFLLLLLLGQQASFAAPKNVSVKPEPTWIKKLPARTQTSINPNNVNGGFHYLLLNTQFEVARQEVYYHNVYKFTTEEGVQSYSELRLNFDPNHEQLQLHKVLVWRNGKAIDKLNLSKVKVLQREQGMDRGIYDESLTAVLVLEDVRVGDILEYACTIKGGNPVFGGKFFNAFNLQGYDPMDEMLVHIVAPQHRKINYKLHLTKKKPSITTADGNTTYTWHLKDLPATVVDDETPSWYDPYPGVYVSEFKSWQEVVAWALPLYEGYGKPGKALQAKIDSIKCTYGSDEKRLEEALRFVQDEVRYLGYEAGIGGFKPRAPSEVYASRFGDCKDKALLLCTMLRQMGITAYPALVNSTYQKQIENQLPSPYAFNHCIVQVQLLGGQTYWYDATISKQRGDFKNIYLPNYGKALVLAPTTKALATVTSPAADFPHVSAQEIYHIKAIDKPVMLEVRTEYSGSEADYQRSNFATTSLQDIEKSYLNFYANQYPDIEKAADIAFEDWEANNTFTVIEKYTIDNFWAAQADNAEVVEAWFTPQVLQGYIRQPKTSKRTMPLALSYPLHVEQKITVLLPEAWPIANEQKAIEDDAFFFQKTVSYGTTGTELTLHYTYQSHQDFVEAAGTAKYLSNQKELLNELSYGLTYNQTLASSGTDSQFSWGVLLLAVLLLAGFSFGAYRLYFWDPSPVPGYSLLDKQSIGGWLILPMIGLALTPLRIVVSLFTDDFFNKAVWTALLDASSGAYSPAMAGVLGMELVVNIAFIVLSALLFILAVKQRTSVPKLMVAYYAFNLVFILLDVALVSLLNVPLGNSGETAGEVARAVIGAAIWIPYFTLSTRVKATFVVQLQPVLPEEEYIPAPSGEEEQVHA